MFGKKPQIIKYDARAYQLFPGDSEAMFVRINPQITDLKAQIEVPANYHVFFMKSGDYSEPLKSGVSDIFADKHEAKNFKKGQSLDILFAKKDKSVEASWIIQGDSSTIFQDKETKELITLNYCDGSFTVKVKNPTVFHREVVGDNSIYRASDLERDALAIVKTAFIDCFFNAIEDDDIDFSSIVRHRVRIAELVCKALNKRIELKGFEFVSFDIDKLDLDYEKVKGIKSTRNEKDEILSDRDAKLREIAREEEDRHFKHEEKMAEILANSKHEGKAEIKTKVCPECGRENPADVNNCVFCHAEIK